MESTISEYNLMSDTGFLKMYQGKHAVLNGQTVVFGKYKCSVLNDQPGILKKNVLNIQDYDSIYDYSSNNFRLEKKS